MTNKSYYHLLKFACLQINNNQLSKVRVSITSLCHFYYLWSSVIFYMFPAPLSPCCDWDCLCCPLSFTTLCWYFSFCYSVKLVLAHSKCLTIIILSLEILWYFFCITVINLYNNSVNNGKPEVASIRICGFLFKKNSILEVLGKWRLVEETSSSNHTAVQRSSVLLLRGEINNTGTIPHQSPTHLWDVLLGNA